MNGYSGHPPGIFTDAHASAQQTSDPPSPRLLSWNEERNLALTFRGGSDAHASALADAMNLAQHKRVPEAPRSAG